MNKGTVKLFFPEQVKKFEEGRCPFCDKKIDPLNEFENELSKKEFKISGLCQTCQNRVFKEQ